ncbi:hypothetical protein ACFX11_030262 [Malus domestica]
MKSVHNSINECSTRMMQRQRSMASQKLGIDTIRYNTTLRLQPHIVNSAELSESPFPALNDPLAVGKLELGMAWLLLLSLQRTESSTCPISTLAHVLSGFRKAPRIPV